MDKQSIEELISSAAEAAEHFTPDELEEYAEAIRCPFCGAYGPNMLGVLGRRAHYRCRDCGGDYSHDRSTLPGAS